MYVLGLSICFRSYKNKQAQLRIFSGDKLIDEITLTSDINLRTFTEHESIASRHFYGATTDPKIDAYRDYQNKLIKKVKTNLRTYKQEHDLDRDDKELLGFDLMRGQNEPRIRKRTYRLPEKLFLYDIDEKNIGEKITIECTNHNNNYTNGFMTQTSYYQFFDIFLIPKSFLEKGSLKEILTRLLKNGHCENITKQDIQTNNTWPSAKKVKYRGTTFSERGQKQALGSIWGIPLGGHFYLDIDVVKKHKILLLSDKANSKGRYLVDFVILIIIVYFDLINKFIYENQRSNHT